MGKVLATKSPKGKSLFTSPASADLALSGGRPGVSVSNVIPFPKRNKGTAEQAEITVYSFSEGVLSKTLELGKDGELKKTPEANLWKGHARRVPVADLSELAEIIRQLKNNEAITLGRLLPDLPDKVKVTTKEKLNGSTGVIARAREFMCYKEGCAAIVLLDYDTHEKPANIVVKGFWKTLLKVCPELRNAGRVVRASTSAGLYRTDTNKDIPGSSGVHIYKTAKDGSDVQRFLRTLLERAWLNGYGWIMITENGRMLERSIVDHTVWKPEGFAFEAPPILKKPLAQHAGRREPVVIEGEVIDTLAACPSLTSAERELFDRLVAEAKEERREEAERVKVAYDEARVADLVRKGVSREKAKAQVEGMYREVLTSDTELLFKSPALKGCTVKDVLGDPKRFEGKYLADPAEISLGRDKCIVMVRRDNSWPWINVFSHGTDNRSYSLMYTEEDRAELNAFELARVRDAEDIIAKLMKEKAAAESSLASPESNVVPLKTRLMQTSAEFVAGFKPPDYLIDGLLQRRYVYSLTGPTGSGKTAIALLIALHVALGSSLADMDVEKGRVLFFAGENPDDVRSRWIKLCEAYGANPDMIDVVFMPFTLPLSEDKIRKRIDAEAAEHGPFSLLIVDTSAAYYSGDDENDNVALGNHARMLRSFVDLPGGPTILVTCHPTKNPDMNNLLPRGGGAFLAEVDGNLVCIKERGSMVAEISTHGKFRGPEFAPFPFKLVSATSDRLKDTKGRSIWTVYAEAISSEEQEEIERQGRSQQDELLKAMLDGPGRSLVELAEYLLWNAQKGQPNKVKAQRMMDKLAKDKLVEKRRDGHYVLTTKGEAEAKDVPGVRVTVKKNKE